MNHRAARVIAIGANGHGRSAGCSCCNVPRSRLPTFARTVRTRIRRVGAEEIAEALAPNDTSPWDDLCDCDECSRPECRAVWGFDVDPLAFDEEGDRWRFEDAQPYADAP